MLRVRDIRVVGGRHTTAEAIGRAAGVTPADNLLTLSTEHVAQRATSLPWVRRARVERILPGTLVVSIKERRPALILAVGTRRFTLDARGRVLERGTARAGLPVLTAFEADRVRPGDRVRTGPAGAAIKALRSLRPALRDSVVAAFAPSLERISFSLTDGTLVRFGAAERLTAKNRVLAALLRRLKQEERYFSYVDVRVPENPAVSALAPPESDVPRTTSLPTPGR
jgi:cell division protein FtsQ